MSTSIDNSQLSLSSYSTVVFGAPAVVPSLDADYSVAAPASDASPNAGVRVLVLSPHPDDESLGCGGTLKKLTDAGATVHVAFMTCGERGGQPGSTLPAIDQVVLGNCRALEAAAACRTLGVQQVFFLSGNDGFLDQQPELSDEVLQLLLTGGYSQVFCPWPFDVHNDHCATYDLLAAALAGCDVNPQIWLYEVWSTLHPNTLVSIDDTIETKQQAIRAHVSQLHNYDYLAGFMALSRYRGILLPGARHVEAFYVCDRDCFLQFRTQGIYADQQCFLRRELAGAHAG